MDDKNDKETVDWKEIQEHITKHGMTGIKAVVGSNINKWKDIPIHIGITGQSGVGKSSFINAIRGMDADEEGAAKVGLKESTMDVTHYTHPKNRSLSFWDLPGAGTEKFPKQTYLEQVYFGRYDFFIIVSCTRFTELDSWLASEIQSRRKQFFFVRTKIDEDMESDEKAHPKTHSPDMLIRDVRQYSSGNLVAFDNPKVFIISNFDTDRYDFPDLVKELLDSLPDLKKRETLALSMSAINSEMINEKRQVLQSRIWKVVLSSTAGSILKLASGSSVAADFGALTIEINFYKEQFGLDDNTLESFGELMGVNIETLKENFETTCMPITQETITEMMQSGVAFIKAAKPKKASKVASTTGEQALAATKKAGGSSKLETFEKFIPIIGAAIATSISFTSTYRLLSEILDKMEADACRLIHKVVEARKCF